MAENGTRLVDLANRKTLYANWGRRKNGYLTAIDDGFSASGFEQFNGTGLVEIGSRKMFDTD